MYYPNTESGFFISRPNRFIAHVQINGRMEVCHVKNTGRCRELLLPGSRVVVQRCPGENRKTQFDLIAVWKGERLINMDAQAPNPIFAEWLQESGAFPLITGIYPEKSFGGSRLDFFIETEGRGVFVEVKGVTLEENDIARFPDAPTLRGLRHLNELQNCITAGFGAYIVFIIQMEKIQCFQPNWAMHPAFGEALRRAKSAGVGILALDCQLSENTITAANIVEVQL